MAGCAQKPSQPVDSGALNFRIDEGDRINLFLRRGPVAAHLVARSGTRPRLLVAFPAGNSGVGLWFRPTLARFAIEGAPRAVSDHGLHGLETAITIHARSLDIEKAVLSSVRVLRDFEFSHSIPEAVRTEPVVNHRAIVWHRNRIDGAPGYRLSLAVDQGRITRGSDGTIRLLAGGRGVIAVRLTAMTGETPLTPLVDPLLGSGINAEDRRVRNILSFLSYREKFLAGSWRFDTYFGRDTLMSIRLLMPRLSTDAIESGLGSVLERLSPEGEVAHEEEIGEFAVLHHRRDGQARDTAPYFDYGMIDDDFMLAPVAAHFLLDDPRGRARAARFLGQKIDGIPVGERLARNLVWVVRRAARFATDPELQNLIRIKAGRTTGNWRDSNDGLGGGTYPYDVNAVLVPAALRAVGRFCASGLLAPYLRNAEIASADREAHVWRDRVPVLYRVRRAEPAAQLAVDAYAAQLGIGAPRVEGPIDFDALALDDLGHPIAVMNSDPGFELVFGDPDADRIGRTIGLIERRFPGGLMTDAGLIVANPVFAPPALRRRFPASAYHGTVVWSWQQALMLAGLARQEQRSDLSETLRARIARAHETLRAVVFANRSLRASELWSWRWSDGKFIAKPFGGAADADESNAAQLWSTVYLGLP